MRLASPPQYLELELTESLLLANAEVMVSVVRGVEGYGGDASD